MKTLPTIIRPRAQATTTTAAVANNTPSFSHQVRMTAPTPIAIVKSSPDILPSSGDNTVSMTIDIDHDDVITVTTGEKQQQNPNPASLRPSSEPCASLLQYLPGPEPTPPAERATTSSRVLNNGEVVVVDGIHYLNRGGLVFLDCPLCAKFVGLCALDAHLARVHQRNEIECPAGRNMCNKTLSTCSHVARHLMGSHFTLRCRKENCGLWLYAHQAKSHVCGNKKSGSPVLFPLPIDSETGKLLKLSKA